MIKVNPIFSPKIWGSNNLRKYGFDIQDEKTGEAWIISAYPGNSSILDNGEELNSFYKENKELFNNYPTEEFPLLAKILDAADDLSIQVHPNDEKAKELENYPFGKTECWYILDAKEDGDIVIGINANNKDEAKALIDNGDWDNLLKKELITRGDLFDIEAGTVHAILSGTIVYELQQSSDITYRLYDFDRRDDEGNLRELHIDKSLEVIDYSNADRRRKPELVSSSEEIERYSLVNNKIYSLERWVVKDKTTINLSKDEKNFLLVTAIEGSITINGVKLDAYQSGIITSNELENIKLEGNGVLLVGNPN